MENLWHPPQIHPGIELEISDVHIPQQSREQIVDCVRRLGGFCADAILDEETSIFSINAVDGLIGYRMELSTAVVYGDPVCHPKDWERLVGAFHRHCVEKGLAIIYIATTEKFARWAHPNHCGALIQFGQEVTIDPHQDPKALTGVHASLVRRKVRHAIKEGSEARELLTSDPQVEAGMEEVSRRWLAGRKGLQIHISKARLFVDRQGKRWFYAMQGGRVTGVVVLNRLWNRDGWLVNHLMRTKDAANGTPELLITTVLETLRKENCHYVTFGTVTTPDLEEIGGLHPMTAWLCRRLYRLVIWWFHLDTHQQFWGKFNPSAAPLFILFGNSAVGVGEIRALLRALNVTK